MSERVFTNWSGRVRCAPRDFAVPASLDDLIALVRRAAAEGRTVRVVGSGHSFSDLCKNDDLLVSLDGLQGLAEVDRASCEAVVWAGTKLHTLNRLLDAEGLAMENLGDIDRQSIAGAVSTGTHGTGVNFGNLSTQVIAITLLTAEGELIECSEKENPKIFKAAQVSLGALGVLVKLRLRLVRSYKLEYVHRPGHFEETLNRAEEYCAGNRQFEFYLFPHTETVQLKFLNRTDAPRTNRPIRKWINDVAMENLAFGAISRLCRAKPERCPAMSRVVASMVKGGRCVDAGHKVLSTTRLVRFNEMEYALPADRGLAALREVKDYIARTPVAVHFPIEVRWVKGDAAWLSPHYGRDAIAISLHQYVGMAYEDYFAACEAIFRRYGGRPHWGKLHSLTQADFPMLYPEWDAFQLVRRRLDPKGMFANDHLRTMLGPAADAPQGAPA